MCVCERERERVSVWCVCGYGCVRLRVCVYIVFGMTTTVVLLIRAPYFNFVWVWNRHLLFGYLTVGTTMERVFLGLKGALINRTTVV
jgi:hypothetical protein